MSNIFFLLNYNPHPMGRNVMCGGSGFRPTMEYIYGCGDIFYFLQISMFFFLTGGSSQLKRLNKNKQFPVCSLGPDQQPLDVGELHAYMYDNTANTHLIGCV